jgi:hypothetical protein
MLVSLWTGLRGEVGSPRHHQTSAPMAQGHGGRPRGRSQRRMSNTQPSTLKGHRTINHHPLTIPPRFPEPRTPNSDPLRPPESRLSRSGRDIEALGQRVNHHPSPIPILHLQPWHPLKLAQVSGGKLEVVGEAGGGQPGIMNADHVARASEVGP